MHRAALAAIGSLLLVAVSRPIPRGVLLLASEPVAFDASFVPHFSANQIAKTSDATRTGLARFAATERGRTLLGYFAAGAYRITVIEDAVDGGYGSAPEPGLATLAAAADPAITKNYELVLNPRVFAVPKDMVPLPNQPATPADAMAVAWAAEMLHVYFYSRGISLPHHSREDFQDEWRAIAAELGFPTLTHGDAQEAPVRRRPIRPVTRRP